MSSEEQSPAQSEKEMESLAEYFQSTSLADMESSEVEVEPARYPMVSRSIRMEQAVMAEIRKVARSRGVPVTQLMRQWVRQGLEQAKAEDAVGDVERPSVKRPEGRPQSGTCINPLKEYTSISGLGRLYSGRAVRYSPEANREAAAIRLIERKVLVERAMRGSQPATGRATGATTRERSS